MLLAMVIPLSTYFISGRNQSAPETKIDYKALFGLGFLGEKGRFAGMDEGFPFRRTMAGMYMRVYETGQQVPAARIYCLGACQICTGSRNCRYFSVFDI